MRTVAPPRLVVTGASGYLGARVVACAAQHADVIGLLHRSAPPAALPGVRYHEVDLTSATATKALLAELKPDAVIHTAAANPGADPRQFRPVNVGGSRAVAEALAQGPAASRLVHVSTDVVHAGTQAPYADDAQPTPLNEYGRSKAEAEAVVLGILPEAAVVRTSLIYGFHQPDHSTDGFIARLRRGERLELFADVLRQPVWVEALSANLIRLALDMPSVGGPLNVAGNEPMTRAAFGRLMLSWWGIRAAEDQIADVAAAGRPGVPLDLRLDLDRANQLGLELPGVSEVVSLTTRLNSGASADD